MLQIMTILQIYGTSLHCRNLFLTTVPKEKIIKILQKIINPFSNAFLTPSQLRLVHYILHNQRLNFLEESILNENGQRIDFSRNFKDRFLLQTCVGKSLYPKMIDVYNNTVRRYLRQVQCCKFFWIQNIEAICMLKIFGSCKEKTKKSARNHSS